MANNPAEILQIYAWQDRWVDVADVVETQKSQLSETAVVSGQAYNNVTKKVGQYGVPIRSAVVPCHIWRPLVEKAGFKIEDIPKTWDAYFDFFKKVQDNLRKQGERKVYGLGFQVTARERYLDKLRVDCAACPLNAGCDETAMVRRPPARRPAFPLPVVSQGEHAR